MLKVLRPTPTHFGIYVTDLELMVNFYIQLFGLTITDRGRGVTFDNELVFTSASEDQHHQFVFASGRPKEATFSTIMQMSFLVPSIQHLRDLSKLATSLGASKMRSLNHGNSLSVYFLDPEGNLVEMYVDLPYYVSQPHGEPLDLTLSDQEILEQTEKANRLDPSFKTMERWVEDFRQASHSSSNPSSL